MDGALGAAGTTAAAIGFDKLGQVGVLYRGLEAKVGALATIMFTSVLFGMVHYLGFGWPRAVATGCLGLLFGVIRWRTGNTTAAMVTHATINVAAASVGTAMVLIAAYML